MIKNYLLLLALCFFSSVNAQIINFSDTNFKAKLLQANETNYIASNDNGESVKIDTNSDNEIQISEALQITSLNVSSSNVSSLEEIQYFTNLGSLYCSRNKITSLNVDNLINLFSLMCDDNLITSLNVSKLSKLSGLSCSKNQLTSLDLSYSSDLSSLNCSDNKLTSLNFSNLEKITSLSCDINKLTSLNVSNFKDLLYLNFSHNELTSIDCSNLNKLQTIFGENNLLTSLILKNSINIARLYIANNQISNLDVNDLINLEQIDCAFNKMTSLSLSGFTKFAELTCSNNQITNLNLSLPNLVVLDCSSNQLNQINLQNVPKITQFYCHENALTNLDISVLPDLETFSFYKNQIKTLDFSNSSKIIYITGGVNPLESVDFSYLLNLESIWIGYTPLKTIDFSNSKKLNELNISNCSNLEFINLKNGSKENLDFLEEDLATIELDGRNFSNCPKLQYVCDDESNLEIIAQKIALYNYTNCVIGNYCSFETGEINYTFQGKSQVDINNNGCDAGDSATSYLKFSISNGNNPESVITDSNGLYSFKVPAGSYTITPIIENGNYFSISPVSINVDFPTQTSPLNQDICLVPNGSHKDLEISFLPLEIARPGFDVKYKIIYKNKGNVVQSGKVNLSFSDSVLDLVSTSLTVSNQTQNNLIWDFTNLKPFETREITLKLNVNSPTEIPAVNNNDILKYTASINSSEIDEIPIDNTFELNQTVLGSYDPNDKTCLEGNVIKPELIGEYVHYLIRFENTGNYQAENIVVKDIIDTSRFDISTLMPTSASHSYTTKISNENKVEFIFEKINLPFDDANNDGYIAFKIKTLPTLKVGDSFTNEANIYFDYNYPILTNKATSTFKTLGIQDFEFSNYFNVYPNPAKNDLNISSNNQVEIQSVSIYNILGQLVIAVPNAEKATKVDVSKLRNGSYILKIKTDKGISGTKFIKE